MKTEFWLNIHATPFMILVVVLGLDPLHWILRAPSVWELDLCFLLFRCVLYYKGVVEMLMAVNVCLIFGLIVVCSMVDFIKRLSRRKTSEELDLEMIQFYKELQIYGGYINENFCNFTVPPLIFFGIAFIILTLYGSIRVVGKVSWILYPIAPIACFLGTLFLVTLLPYAARIFENSNTYLMRMSRNLSKKYDKRLVKSLRPLSICIGPFGKVDQDLLPTALKYLIDYTSSLLITF